MKKPPAQITTLINPTIITDSFESEHLCSSLEMIKTTPALRSAIPGPFVYSYKNLRKLPKGLLMSWPLDDDHRTYIHVSEHVSLTVRKVNYLGATRIEEIKYRASYSPVANEFAVPIKRRIPLDLIGNCANSVLNLWANDLCNECLTKNPCTSKQLCK